MCENPRTTQSSEDEAWEQLAASLKSRGDGKVISFAMIEPTREELETMILDKFQPGFVEKTKEK